VAVKNGKRSTTKPGEVGPEPDVLKKSAPTPVPPSAAVKTKKGRKRTKKRMRKAARKSIKSTETPAGKTPKYPRHSLAQCLRIPKAILEQNAGKPSTEKETAQFAGVAYGGAFLLEISSCIKYGLLARPAPRQIAITPLAQRILRPQNQQDEIGGLREAFLNAPDLSAVYKHYRGENLPDPQFFQNALIDKFKIPQEKVAEFTEVFIDSLKTAKLLDEEHGKRRLLDISSDVSIRTESTEELKKLGKAVTIAEGDTCFVMMPFAKPVGDHYEKIYEPAIQKARLRPMRADNDIFGPGKIIDQVWSGINAARVLVAELTGRNPNVFYELGLAHAMGKPVVLVSSNEVDVPFDLKHIRVIYYDVTDPFWGEKLITKVAENVLSALKNPEEAVFKPPV
jgi:hypothetical protein